MAIVSLWFLLGCMYLILPCCKNAIEGQHFSQSGCRLSYRIADCSYLQLTSVPKDFPNDIEELVLVFNNIKRITRPALSLYPDLKSLSLQSNGLELIESDTFQGTTGLESLSLQDNSISTDYIQASEALRFIPSLKKLDLSRNGLKMNMVTALLRNLKSLEYLSLDNNMIMRLEDSVFAGLHELKQLSLQRNYIYEIETGTFDHLVKLKTLNLAFNSLPCIVDFSLTQLQTLNLSFNQLEWFQSMENDVEFQLELLDISHNMLLFFPLLPQRHHIHKLLLSENRMRFYADLFDANSSTVDFLIIENNSTNISSINLWEEEKITSNISTIQYLDMSHNHFTYLPDGFIEKMTSLIELKLDWNCLETFSISHLENASSLAELDLSYNKISELKLNNHSHSFLGLLYFNVSRNNLQMLPRHIFSGMNGLRTLDLSHNRLKLCCSQVGTVGVHGNDCVDIRYLTALKNLYLSGCGMVLDARCNFYGTTLTHLDLSDNHIQSLSSLQDTSRTLLFLSLRNSLPSNLSDVFSTYQNLRYLDLSENNLTNFPRSLTGLSLKSLDLRKNNLTFLPLYDRYENLLKTLNVVYLSKNPFDCCELSWLDVLRKSGSINIPDLLHVTCNFSHHFMSAQDLPLDVLHSCQWKTGGTLLYLLLTLPICVTFLVALLLVILTFKDVLLQALKRCCRRSTSY
ncbi:transforming growth factor beta activator LRRC33 [Pelobates fuscus]|uniref:transforming growth factor beta activator LRRC33 n=1 Tax=Pelobates fuscus TaxID=191477 RepID=UPI002FE4AD0C